VITLAPLLKSEEPEKEPPKESSKDLKEFKEKIEKEKTEGSTRKKSTGEKKEMPKEAVSTQTKTEPLPEAKVDVAENGTKTKKQDE
jgi:hypothetical protein